MDSFLDFVLYCGAVSACVLSGLVFGLACGYILGIICRAIYMTLTA